MLRSFILSFAVPFTSLWLASRFDSGLIVDNYFGRIIVKNDKKVKSRVDTKPISVNTASLHQDTKTNQPREEQKQKNVQNQPENSVKNEINDGKHTPLMTKIEKARNIYKSRKSSGKGNNGSEHLEAIYETLDLADLLREREVEIHDGGTTRSECLSLYQEALSLLLQDNDNSNTSFVQLEDEEFGVRMYGDYNDYMFMNLRRKKSREGLLLHTYTNLGKQLFMSDLFENAVEMFTNALQIEPNNVDVLGFRASTYTILGKYKLAGEDFARVLSHDKPRIAINAFTGAAKVLTAMRKEAEVIPGLSWDVLIEIVVPLIKEHKEKYDQIVSKSQQINEFALICNNLKTQHLTMFTYYDIHTKNEKLAWYHLSEAYKYKMAAKPPYQFQMEQQRIDSIKGIFTRTFFPENIGIVSKRPIFIIGFPRSGSTLLERILDAHPEIVGTGEDSVFNGRLPQIRDAIVAASNSGSAQILHNSIKEQAHTTLKIMKERHEASKQYQSELNKKFTTNQSINDNAASDITKEQLHPRRYVDKMLTNYMNVGFIHMLFPDALILHIAREPMDTLFSAFKMDFPPGNLDYTSDFKSLAHMYMSYRDVMEHWDNVLPGRITHVRYEDLVNDTANIAKALIAKTGLSWHEDILEFHKKKHAVNTLSSTQVRQGIYKDGIQSWRKYEQYLIPLQNMVNPKWIKHSTQTTLTNP